MNSAAFDVLIKILESYRPQIPLGGMWRNPIHRQIILKGFNIIH